jgi:hypothetical protein
MDRSNRLGQAAGCRSVVSGSVLTRYSDKCRVDSEACPLEIAATPLELSSEVMVV